MTPAFNAFAAIIPVTRSPTSTPTMTQIAFLNLGFTDLSVRFCLSLCPFLRPADLFVHFGPYGLSAAFSGAGHAGGRLDLQEQTQGSSFGNRYVDVVAGSWHKSGRDIYIIVR